MSQPNEPPLALESWHITVKLNDGTDFMITELEHAIPSYSYYRIRDVVLQSFDAYVDHLKGKYAGEVKDALNPLGKYKLVNDETK